MRIVLLLNVLSFVCQVRLMVLSLLEMSERGHPDLWFRKTFDLQSSHQITAWMGGALAWEHTEMPWKSGNLWLDQAGIWITVSACILMYHRSRGVEAVSAAASIRLTCDVWSSVFAFHRCPCGLVPLWPCGLVASTQLTVGWYTGCVNKKEHIKDLSTSN